MNQGAPMISTIFDDIITATTSTYNEVTKPKSYNIHILRITKYVPSILFVFGCIGNFLSIIVFLRPKLRSSHTSFMFILLALSDTSVLFTAHLHNVFKTWFSLDIKMESDISCKASHLYYHVL